MPISAHASEHDSEHNLCLKNDLFNVIQVISAHASEPPSEHDSEHDSEHNLCLKNDLFHKLFNTNCFFYVHKSYLKHNDAFWNFLSNYQLIITKVSRLTGYLNKR